MMTK